MYHLLSRVELKLLDTHFLYGAQLIVHQELNLVVGLICAVIVCVLCQHPLTLSHTDFLTGLYCRELFGAVEDIKVH